MKIKLIILSLLFSSSAFSTGILLTCENNTLGKGPFINTDYVFTPKDDPRCGLEKPTNYAYIKFDTEEESAVVEYFACSVNAMSMTSSAYNATVKKLPDEYSFQHLNPYGYKWEHVVSRTDLTIRGTQVTGICKMEEISKEENIF